MLWLGKELGFRRPEDWYRLRYKDFLAHCGGGLMQEFRSRTRLLRELLPQLNWDHWERDCPPNDQQIRQWAKAYFARNGKWPARKTSSGIPRMRKQLSRP